MGTVSVKTQEKARRRRGTRRKTNNRGIPAKVLGIVVVLSLLDCLSRILDTVESIVKVRDASTIGTIHYQLLLRVTRASSGIL